MNIPLIVFDAATHSGENSQQGDHFGQKGFLRGGLILVRLLLLFAAIVDHVGEMGHVLDKFGHEVEREVQIARPHGPE
jgi:hypothetical protein